MLRDSEISRRHILDGQHIGGDAGYDVIGCGCGWFLMVLIAGTSAGLTWAGLIRMLGAPTGRETIYLDVSDIDALLSKKYTRSQLETIIGLASSGEVNEYGKK